MRFLEEKDFVISLLKEVSKRYLGEIHFNKVEQKSEFDLVTDIDKKIERELIEKIHYKYPKDVFVSEEMNPKNAVIGRTWIIDPIDGTCNMAHNMKLFGIQCALCIDGNPVLSFIHLPFFNELYYAILGEGAYLNNKRISSLKSTTLNNCIVSYGDYTHKDIEVAKRQHNSMGELYKKIAKIRMFGAACLDFSFVASGKTDGCVVLTKNLWDIVPGILLSIEAGASVCDINGEEYKLGSYGAIVTNNAILKKEILKSLQLNK